MSLIIQIIISVVVVYLVFSVIVYVVVEWWAGFRQLRGRMLQKAIYDLFNDVSNSNFGKQIYDHPQVRKLRRDKDGLPSYIPANNIAVSLIDLVKEKQKVSPEDKREDPFPLFLSGLQKLNQGDLKTLLASIAEHSTDLKTLTSSIEKWYNDYMDRVSGWYKRKTRVVVLIVATLVTLSFNVDTLYIVKTSTTDPELRARMNMLADQLVKDSSFAGLVAESRNLNSSGEYFNEYVNDSSVHGETDTMNMQDQPLSQDSAIAANTAERLKQFQELRQLVQQWDLPVGWKIRKDESWLLIILGWLLTIVALSFGAPFWFDALKRLVNIRNSGLVPKK